MRISGHAGHLCSAIVDDLLARPQSKDCSTARVRGAGKFDRSGTCTRVMAQTCQQCDASDLVDRSSQLCWLLDSARISDAKPSVRGRGASQKSFRCLDQAGPGLEDDVWIDTEGLFWYVFV